MNTLKNKAGVRIVHTSSVLPEQQVTNEMLREYFKGYPTKWVEQKLGIKERRLAFNFSKWSMTDGFYDSDLAFKAAQKVLSETKLIIDDIDRIYVSTCTPEETPINDPAPKLHYLLGAKRTTSSRSFVTGCAGMTLSVIDACEAIESGRIKRALVVGSNSVSGYCQRGRDSLSYRYINKLNMTIFGDGAAAIILEAHKEDNKIIATFSGTYGKKSPLFFGSGGSRNPTTYESLNNNEDRFFMDYKEIIARAPEFLDLSLDQVLKSAKIHLDEIDYIIPHQANPLLIREWASKHNVPNYKVGVNGVYYANTVAPSTFIELDEARRQDKVKEGDIVLIVTVGSGWHFGAILFRL